jgi:hypothetical protein
MSTFLDEVFAAQQEPPRPRRAGEGLSGSSKRFAILLTLMVGLTAVPTFIMVRVGVEELRSSAASPVRPILLVVPDPTPPSNKEPLVIEPKQSWSLPVVPPKPVVPQQVPILERKAVVDTSPRPVAKKQRAARLPEPAPAEPSTVEPSTSDTVPSEPKQGKYRHHHVERPEKPEVTKPDFIKPDFIKPDFIKPDFIKPDIVKPDIAKPYRERAARPRS